MGTKRQIFITRAFMVSTFIFLTEISHNFFVKGGTLGNHEKRAGMVPRVAPPPCPSLSVAALMAFLAVTIALRQVAHSEVHLLFRQF